MTHFIYHTFLFFLSFSCLIKSQTNDGSALKQKACDRIENLVTTLVTCDQVIIWFDYVSTSLADGIDINTIISGFQPVVVDSLTSSQNLTIVSKGSPLIFTLGMSGIQLAMDTFISVMKNNLMPLANQVDSLVQMWISDGMEKNVIENQIYYYGLSFFTEKRIGTLFKRYEKAIGQSKYAALKSAFSPLVKFSLYTI